MRRMLALLFSGLIVVTNAAYAAPKAITAPPLEEVMTTPVAPVASGPVQIPLITWGADLRTIYANGNSRSTGL